MQTGSKQEEASPFLLQPPLITLWQSLNGSQEWGLWAPEPASPDESRRAALHPRIIQYFMQQIYVSEVLTGKMWLLTTLTGWRYCEGQGANTCQAVK